MTCEQTAQTAVLGQETRSIREARPSRYGARAEAAPEESAAAVMSEATSGPGAPAAPAAPETTSEPPALAADAPGAPGAPEGPAPIRVVLVDDDPLITRSLATILQADGKVVVAATGTRGAGAAALYEQCRPDIMLLDIRMPDRSGLDAAQDILAAHPEARIVFLTTFADDDYLVRALRLGARGYLIKQEAATLARSLRAVMDGALVLGSEVSERVGALVGNGHEGTPRTAGDSARAAHGEPIGNSARAAHGEPIRNSARAAHGEPIRNSARAGRGERTPSFPALPDDAATDDRRTPAFAADFTERERDIARLVADGLDNREIAQALYLSEGTVRNHISALLQKTGLKNRTQLAIAWWR